MWNLAYSSCSKFPSYILELKWKVGPSDHSSIFNFFYVQRSRKWSPHGNRRGCQSWRTTLTGDHSPQTATSVVRGEKTNSNIKLIKQVFHGAAPGQLEQGPGLPESEAQPRHRPWLRAKAGGRGSHVSKQVMTQLERYNHRVFSRQFDNILIKEAITLCKMAKIEFYGTKA